ncbi:MAG: helix-turn-helix domain-containing protein [Pseudomonadota bacterium]
MPEAPKMCSKIQRIATGAKADRIAPAQLLGKFEAMEGESRVYTSSVLACPICALLGVEWSKVIEKVELGDFDSSKTALLMSAEEYLHVWSVMVSLSVEQNIAALLGRRIAGGPAIPVLFAMSTAPNFEVGLSRISRYKHMFGPVRFVTSNLGDSCTIRVLSDSSHATLPGTLSSAQIIYLHAKTLAMAVRHLKPLDVSLPLPMDERVALTELFQMVPTEGEAKITYREVSMRTPFIAPNEELWKETERDLESQSLIMSQNAPVSNRLRAVMLESFGTPDSSLDHACARLNVSKSTLLRRLRDEGTTFRKLRDGLRRELAERYLKTSDLNNQQISFLLGFNNISAFQRAFRGWTGMTPRSFRTANTRSDS